MKGLLLDGRGDAVLNRDLAMTEGTALTAQTIRTVLSTNQGEWFLNENEGIQFRAILGKRVEEDRLRDEIQSGLVQVDESLLLIDFECETEGRIRRAHFTARDSAGTTIEEVLPLAY